MAILIAAPEKSLRPQQVDSLEQQFQYLASQWRHETALQSSVSAIAMHPAYQQIIGMGDRALPLIFKDLRREPDHWFWALQAITGENPVSEQNAGDLEAMTGDWLVWASTHGSF